MRFDEIDDDEIEDETDLSILFMRFHPPAK